ncbi:MAG: PIN domain-containing protein [Flavobacteriales bacterium]|nr:PIN domain-containing protein [Flavobacteriales bacterium]
MGKVICLDSQVVVWGIKGEAEPGQEAKIGRAKALLALLAEEKAIIIIPAPVLSEILMRVPAAEHGKIVNFITARFRVPPFDAAAAAIAAQIRQKLMSEGEFKKIQKSSTREVVKFDIQIIAIAKLHGAKTIYSEDRGLKNAAEGWGGGVKVSAMPNVGVQVPMFHEDDLPAERPKKAAKRGATLKIHGTLDQVLKVAVKQAPKAAKKARKKAAKRKPKK